MLSTQTLQVFLTALYLSHSSCFSLVYGRHQLYRKYQNGSAVSEGVGPSGESEKEERIVFFLQERQVKISSKL